MINKVKEIIIFGGGTSGWLAAAYLVKNLTSPIKITLIESTEIGAIGVGEGTQPATARFLYDAGIMPKTWMKPSNASFKFGVEFIGWTEKNFFVDNDFIENSIIGPEVRVIDYFMDKPIEEFYDYLPAYQMAKANKSPKMAGMDTNYALPGHREYGAVHFSALDILTSIKDIIGDKIGYFDTKIVDIKKDNNGITALIDETGRIHTADLYLDCSGFNSILLEKTLGVNFNSIEKILPCNRAVVIPTEFTNPEEECFPYTKATAMDAGWMFTIPTFKRTGNGYVYSDRHITPDQAEQELREKIGNPTTPARHIKMKCGSHDVVAFKNVVAVGLSAGFVEPLEATGITFTTSIVEMLTRLLNQHSAIWNQNAQNSLNINYDKMVTEIVAFVWAHYHYSTKDDTLFWKDIQKQNEEDAPESVMAILNMFLPKMHDRFYLDRTSGFHAGHWFSVLKTGGKYQDATSKLTAEQTKYAEYFIKNQKYRTELVKEIFPNQYEYLKSWYNNDDMF